MVGFDMLWKYRVVLSCSVVTYKPGLLGESAPTVFLFDDCRLLDRKLIYKES